MNKKQVFNHFVLIVIIFYGLFNSELLQMYELFILNSNIIVLLATLIAGLFGFIIAVIPFSIQLLNQNNSENNSKNRFLLKLMKEKKFNFFVKPMFNRFVRALRLMLYLFIYLFCIHIFQIIEIKNIEILKVEYFGISLYTYLLLLFVYMYISLTIYFFVMLRSIIRDLESLVNIFITSKNDEFRNKE